MKLAWRWTNHIWLRLVIHRFEQPLTSWRGQSRWTWGWWKREQVRLMYRGSFPSQTNLCPLGQPASAQMPFAIATCYLTRFALQATELRNLLYIRYMFGGKFLYGFCVAQNWQFYMCQLKLHERRSSHVSSLSCLSRYTHIKDRPSLSDGSICLIKIILRFTYVYDCLLWLLIQPTLSSLDQQLEYYKVLLLW